MLSTNVYLHFMGKAEQALQLYKSIFGGELVSTLRYSEMPGGEKMSPDDRDKILHISLVGEGMTIMASDYINPMGDNIAFGNNFHICVHAENEAEVDRVTEALSRDGQVEMPPNKTFWGAYFSMCRDRFGVQWMVTYDGNQ